MTGTATSRHARPLSGKGRRTFSQAGGSTKSHIFNVADTPRDTKQLAVEVQSPGYPINGGSPAASSIHETTPDAPRPGGGQILKHEVSEH